MKPKTRKLKCYFCGGALRSDNAWFEIHDQETAPFHSEHIRFNQHGGKELYGALAYPGPERLETANGLGLHRLSADACQGRRFKRNRRLTLRPTSTHVV